MDLSFRSVSPSFWTDSELAKLTDTARLLYIGLWQIADDKGWLRWEAAEIAAVLYPYKEVRSRERSVERSREAIQALRGKPRLIVHDCGHAQVPRVEVHQIHRGPPRSNFLREHDDCRRLSRIEQDKVGLTEVRGGEVRGGEVINEARARSRENGSDGDASFREKAAAAGARNAH